MAGEEVLGIKTRNVLTTLVCAWHTGSIATLSVPQLEYLIYNRQMSAAFETPNDMQKLQQS